MPNRPDRLPADSQWIRDLVLGLRGLREMLGISQDEIAMQMGSSQSEVWAIENLKRNFTVRTINRYIACLPIDVAITVTVTIKGDVTTNDTSQEQQPKACDSSGGIVQEGAGTEGGNP